jgi:hypothetical protein
MSAADEDGASGGMNPAAMNAPKNSSGQTIPLIAQTRWNVIWGFKSGSPIA